MLDYICHNCAKFSFIISFKHFYKSYLRLPPYAYYFDYKLCVVGILSCFRNLILFIFLKVITSFFKCRCRSLFQAPFNRKAFKGIKNFGLYCLPVAALANRSTRLSPRCLDHRERRWDIFPLSCWKFASAGTLVVSEEQGECQWRAKGFLLPGIMSMTGPHSDCQCPGEKIHDHLRDGSQHRDVLDHVFPEARSSAIPPLL